METHKRRGSGKIPGFGDWEYVNDLPLTQYFESTRQAGLIRFDSSSAHHHNHYHHHHHGHHHDNGNSNAAQYSSEYVRPGSKQGKGTSEKRKQVREGGSRKQAGKVYNVTVTERTQPNAVKNKQRHLQYDAVICAQPSRVPKAVDEDLYRIPPELLRRKRRLGFFSRCLVPPCAV